MNNKNNRCQACRINYAQQSKSYCRRCQSHIDKGLKPTEIRQMVKRREI